MKKYLFKLCNITIATSLIVIFSLFALFSMGASAQVLLSGTSFDPKPGNESDLYFSINEITYYGLQPGKIHVTPAYAANFTPGSFGSAFQYAITDDPYKLDQTHFINSSANPDYQLVLSPQASGNANIIDYVVTGLKPGTKVEALVTFCSPINPSNQACSFNFASLKWIFNADQFNQVQGQDSRQLKTGECYEYILNSGLTGVVQADGSVSFRINSISNQLCRTVSIKKIEIYGTPSPKIVSTQGNEVCTGEEIILQTENTYQGEIEWQNLTNGTWQIFAKGNKAIYELTNSQIYEFRYAITPLNGPKIYSDIYKVNSAPCCSVFGKTGTKQTIFSEDFGRIDLSDPTGNSFYVWDYTDILNPKEIKITSDNPFRRKLNPAPLNSIYAATGPVMDGSYTIAGYLTSYNSYKNITGAKLEWSNNITGIISIPDISYDHSGKVDGAALFVNPPQNTLGQVIYEKEITQLCFGSQLSYEVWIAVFTNASAGIYTPVNVKVKLIDLGHPENTSEAIATATRQADGGGVWVKISGSLTLQSSSAKIQIINNENNTLTGNDLVIDDIKIKACVPPSVHLTFDKDIFTQQNEACGNPFTLTALVTDNLENYYSNSQNYLFQYTTTPDNPSSWVNLGLPQSLSEFSILPLNHPTLTGLSNGTNVYFRVIVANNLVFLDKNNFQGTLEANINDPCRNYSVSNPIQTTLNCPACKKADPIQITSSSENLSICPEEIVNLSVGPLKYNGASSDAFDITWYYTAIEEENIVKGPTQASSDQIDIFYGDAGKYFLRIRDKAFPEAANCFVTSEVKITAKDINSEDCSVITSTPTKTSQLENIHPNPASDFINVGENAVSCVMYNQYGVNVLTGNNNIVNINNLPGGVYHVFVTYTNEENAVYKLIKR
ncbi:MAG: hypothetical protein NVV82_19735 [Sporocytophaga sp.]|nr:hypothetical protein [Sporocytophaga sp.]